MISERRQGIHRTLMTLPFSACWLHLKICRVIKQSRLDIKPQTDSFTFYKHENHRYNNIHLPCTYAMILNLTGQLKCN